MKVGKLTDDHLRLIIEENDLREVAKEYGVVFDHSNKASCPFHSDGRNGNLHLFEKDDEDPTYFCFSRKCSAGRKWTDKEKTKPNMLTFSDGQQIEDGGPNVIGFVMNIERCTFIEACIILMERAGIEPPQAKVDYRLEKQKKKTHSLNVQYARNLREAEHVKAYLEERGITSKSISRFRLGYIPEDDTSNPVFGKKVAGRLVFGLPEESYNAKSARTVAMAYRTLNDEQPKYYNDYTSELYEKRTYLYGLNEARRAIRRAGYALIFEGYTDVILSHQSGMENAVATCGTAFTTEQMEKLRKLTGNLVFWYDGDSAGYDAMMESIEELLAFGFRVRIIRSDGYDPADVMLKLGQKKEAVQKFIQDKALPAVSVLTEDVLSAYDNKLNQLRLNALDELLPIYESMQNDAERMTFRAIIQQRLGVTIS